MDTAQAFAMGEANRDKEVMTFDWHKAARIIREENPTTCSAGLAGDWEWTGGTIYESGNPVTDSYTYLASTWATPQIDVDGDVRDCFIMKSQSDGWDSDTKWPETAIDILRGRIA